MKPECLITEAALSHFTVPTDVPEGDSPFLLEEHYDGARPPR